eukprot:scaffold2495_cov101-Isochrysis_galbana.AAC.2
MVSTTLHLFFLTTSSPHVERANEDFKIRVTIANLSEKAITLPHMQALASLHVRFKIHDGYDAKDEDQRKLSEKLTAEKLEMLAR